MPFRPCVSGCGRYLAPGDGHDRCLSCLGIEHAEAAFVDESCPHCEGLARAAESVGLEWRPPPCPEPSRLDDWFLGVARCLSSRKCMMSSLEHGRHLSLPETAPVAHPPSPPLTAERRGGIRRSRRWSDQLRCNCVQGPLLPGAVIRCSPPGPVGTRRP